MAKSSNVVNNIYRGLLCDLEQPYLYLKLIPSQYLNTALVIRDFHFINIYKLIIIHCYSYKTHSWYFCGQNLNHFDEFRY